MLLFLFFFIWEQNVKQKKGKIPSDSQNQQADSGTPDNNCQGFFAKNGNDVACTELSSLHHTNSIIAQHLQFQQWQR